MTTSRSAWVFDPAEMELLLIWMYRHLAQHQLGPVLQRLCQMYRLNFFTPRKVSNGAR